MGDKLHPKLNTSENPIAYKYREGKMQRTLRRELKGTEIAEREVAGLGSLTRRFRPCVWFRLAVTLVAIPRQSNRLGSSSSLVSS